MLSPKAEQLIHDYLNLPFQGKNGVRCPYVNNARLKQRGQLRVLIGKGTPTEIVEEAHIISIQYHAGLFEHSGECCLHNKHTGAPVTAHDLRKFLIDHRLGIECSGLVAHVLRAHYLETKKVDLAKKMFTVSARRPLRWLLAKLRPIENIGVRTFANNRNSDVVGSETSGWRFNHLAAGDMITMLETGAHHNRNHIILITKVSATELNYIHSRHWSSEGLYGHGVTEGKIVITNPDKNLLEQNWVEKGFHGKQNETWREAQEAKQLEIRRLKL